MPMFNFPKQHHAATTNQRQNLNPLLDSGKIEWKPEHFPHKMYDLLEDVEQKNLDDIVSWLPDGESFKIHSQVGFEQTIMPMYFSGMSSYKSFRRQLNLYGIYQHRHRPKQDPNGKLCSVGTVSETPCCSCVQPGCDSQKGSHLAPDNRTLFSPVLPLPCLPSACFVATQCAHPTHRTPSLFVF